MARRTDLHDARIHPVGPDSVARQPLPPPTGTIEQLVEAAVIRAIEVSFEPYLARLSEPEPLVYTVAQAATILQVSPDTVSRLIRRGVLDRVPHIDGKQLIPKRSLEELVDGAFVPNVEVVSPDVSSLRVPQRRRTSDP